MSDADGAGTLNVTGDYFNAPYSNTLSLTNTGTVINLAGGATAQTITAVNNIPKLTMSNTNSVTINDNFTITNAWNFSGSGTVYITGTLTVTPAFTIPTGYKVIVQNGAALYSAGGVTVASGGTLQIDGGGELRMAAGKTLNIQAGGILKGIGSSGNPAHIYSYDSSSHFTFTMAGDLYASQLVISRATNSSTGMNVSGNIYQFASVQFRGMKASSYGFTLSNTAVVVPSTLDSIGFYNDDSVAVTPIGSSPKNINATAFTGTALTMNNYSGDLAGITYETDGSNKITWGTIAPTEIQIVNLAPTNNPTATMAANITGTFADFSFVLNASDTATNITQVILTMTGTASMSDLSNVKAYIDASGSKNCAYNAGVDTLVSSSLSFSGSPPKAIINFNAGDLTTSSTTTTQACLHIIATTSTNPTNNKTLSFGIVSSSDVTNSQNYSMSSTSGTPVYGRYTTLNGSATAMWSGANGAAGKNWGTAVNWSTNAVPTTATSCQVGLGSNTTQSNVTPMQCANATLTNGGSLDWNNSANVLEIYNSIAITAGFSFTQASSAIISMKGIQNQTMYFTTSFPGNVVINNTGAASSNQVDVTKNSSIQGSLTCTAGKLNIANGITLTVLGNVTIQNGCTIIVAGGGTLLLGPNSILTVDSGGILQLVGTSTLTSAVGASSGAYNVIVNGTIKAQYYSFSDLNTTGVSIEAGATIDTTYHLQNGTFTNPINNATTLLFLKKQIPGNALTNMDFSSGGSAATGITNINTTGASAGTLSITTYTGDWAGATYSTQPSYLVNWTGLANTISITQEATTPTPMSAGSAYTVGRFGFKQDSIGAGFLDANITQLKLQLIGTGSASDISAVRLYSDVGCTGTGGSLLGSGTFSGNPATVTFNINSGSLSVLHNATATIKVCAYVQFDIASTATNANTVGAQITSAAYFTNDQTYAVSTTFPVTLGAVGTISVPTSYTWTGTTSTAWATATNWSPNGVPSATTNCSIPNVTNDPVIATGTGACKSLTITNGILTVSAGAALDVYGDYTNYGTLTNSGTFTIKDSGSNSHYIDSTPAIASINLAAVGSVYINNAATTITTLGTISSTSVLTIANGKKLTLPNGYSLTSGKIRVEGGGKLEITTAKTLAVAGGILQVAGVNSTLPQTLANVGVIQPTNGTGTFSLSASSGSVDLVGFQLDKLDINGLNLSGTASLTNLIGGQFTNLPTSYSTVKVIQLNTTGTIPATASNIAWTWGAFNTFTTSVNTPTSAQTYTLVSGASGCNNQTISFSGWDGDWYSSVSSFDVTTKIANKATAPTCTITMSGSSSAVSLLSFTATPYNAKVDVQWETNVERDHLGFNIYRTTDLSARFLQVNKTLIRNLKNSTSNRGQYRFIDQDVSNDQNYYYYLEDVDIYGHTTMHGPLFAAPLSILGTPPADGISQNSDTNSTTPGASGTPSTIPNPSFQDLGNGIVILSQTSKSLRIEITPPAPSFAASALNNSYQDVTMAGYSKMTSVGNAELPEKDLLIEVQAFATNASVNNATTIESTLANFYIVPAPSYSLNGSNVLVPSFILSSTYGNNSFYPSSTEFFSIENNLISMNDRKYLKLKVNPMKLNGHTGDLRSASKITIDIGLDGDDWNVVAPSVSSNISVYSVENTLRIEVTKSGMYQINYSDFINSQVEAPFVGTDTQLWRLYLKNSEIPLEIYSATGNFASGDYIRFYAPFTESVESLKNQLILSPVNLTSDSAAPKRMGSVNANPSGQLITNEILNTFTKTFEENLVYVDAFSLGDNKDHYFYQNLYSDVAGDTFTLTTTLPEIDNTNFNNVILKYHVRGELGILGTPVKHRVVLNIGGIQYGEAIFDENERTILTFEVSPDKFISGSNSIELKVPGTFATVGDDDRVLVDKVEISYKGQHVSSTGIADIMIPDQSRVHSLDHFLTNSILGYDLTNVSSPKKLTNINIVLDDSAVTYAAHFYLDNNVDSDYQKHFYFLESTNFYKPSTLSLNPGVHTSLKDSTNSADLIILGEENLLNAVSDLITLRVSQGLLVKTITPDQIYSEFNYGVKSSSAIRDFITSALSNWTRAPRYLLILGDGTNDPKDFNVASLPINGRAIYYKGTLPAPLIPGSFMDFSSDNYFVSTDATHLPKLAVGRIPTSNTDKIKAYIAKVLKYEAGTAAPTTTIKNITFFSDQDTSGHFEQFNLWSQTMMTSALGFNNILYDRAVLGSLNATKVEIQSEFNKGPLLMSLMGHGASDRFGDNIFNTTDANSLTNSKYPIVTTWNCETAYFYDHDNTMKSLGEELILNANGGAIIFIGSTTQTTPPAQAKLAQNFFSQLSSSIKKPWDGGRVGDLLYQAKIGVGSGNYEKDIVNSFVILGDPSLKLPSDLYPASKYVPKAPAAAKKAAFGCNANAADGSRNTPWHEGIIEWMIYMAMIVFGVRKVLRLKFV